MFRIVLLLLLRGVSCGIELAERWQEDELVNYARQVYLNECRWCRITLVIRSEKDELANDFLDRVSSYAAVTSFWTMKLIDYTFEQDLNVTVEHADFIVFFLDETSNNVSMVLYGIEFSVMWNIRAKHLFIVKGVGSSWYLNWAKEAFEYLWAKQALKAFIAFFLDDDIKVMTYNPYIDAYDIDVTDEKDNSPLYQDKVTDMYGYPLKMYHFDNVYRDTFYVEQSNGKTRYRGIDGKYAGTIAEVLNATIIIHPLTDDFSPKILNRADPKTNLMDAMQFFRASFDLDMFLNVMKVFSDYENIDYVCLNERDDLVIVLPRGEKIPQYLYLLLILPLNVFFATVAVLLVISLVMWANQKFSNSTTDGVRIFGDNLRVLLNSPTPNRERNGKEKLLVVLWMFFCLICDSMFTTVLITKLVRPQFYPDINTLEELYQTNITIHTDARSRHFIQYYTNNAQLDAHFITLPLSQSSYGENTNWVKYHRREAFMLGREKFDIIKKFDKYQGRVPYHVMSESPFPTPVGFIIMRDKLIYRSGN